MSYLDQAKAMYQMVGQGQMAEAFEKFYDENVVMVEPNGDTTEGKNANREREKKFSESVKEMHGGGVNGITSNEEESITMVEAWMDITFQDGNRMKIEEVAVQKWNGDKIVHERFYFNMPG